MAIGADQESVRLLQRNGGSTLCALEFDIPGRSFHNVCLCPARVKLVQFFSATVAVFGVGEILDSALRTLSWIGLFLDRLAAPWAKSSCGRKVLITL